MSRLMRAWSGLGLGAKLSWTTLGLLGLFLAALIGTISALAGQIFEERATTQVVDQTRLVVQMIETTDHDLRRRTEALAKAFSADLGSGLVLGEDRIEVNGQATPALRRDGQAINGDLGAVDRFTAHTGAVATVFARQGDDFVRVSTSLRNAQGERVLGTLLDRQHPGYAAVKAGQRYVGLATLFGRQYMTQYDPLRDAAGQVIGLSFIGLDFSDYLAQLKATIRQLKIGPTGYFYILDARSGPPLGQLVVHPTMEGKNLLDQTDADGRPFIKDMLAQRNGFIHYPWINRERGETVAREKVVAFTTLDNWHWVVAGGAYVDEYTAEIRALQRSCAVLGLVCLVLMGAAQAWLARRLISQPLKAASASAQAIAQGDLRVNLDTSRQDEIGELSRSIHRIGDDLSAVVRRVRENAASVASACSQIAQGNQDLSSRTETQSGALQVTASSMSQLGGTARQNAAHAQQASGLANEARGVVTEGGEAVGRVVTTMQEISEASRRIADIIGVIDGISFQTNILALNAAVEAARAGEAGRGFAVVASEVRTLAGRSAEAAREIRGLIQDSVARVDQGSQQVHEAGDTMQRVVQSIQRVADLVSEIDQASQTQHLDVDQAGQSVSQIDQVTQQNAALVEQVAAAAASLESQARELVQTVAVFRTRD